MTLVASIAEPPPSAISRSASSPRASFAPAMTPSRGEWALVPENTPTHSSPSASAVCAARPSAKDAVVVINSRRAPYEAALSLSTSAARRP